MSRAAKIRQYLVSIVAVVGLIAVSILIYPLLLKYFKPPQAKRSAGGSFLFKLKDKDSIDTMIVSEEALLAIDLKTVAVKPAPEPDPLLLPGYLSVDPRKLVPVHSRLPGEVVHIGRIRARDVDGEKA